MKTIWTGIAHLPRKKELANFRVHKSVNIQQEKLGSRVMQVDFFSRTLLVPKGSHLRSRHLFSVEVDHLRPAHTRFCGPSLFKVGKPHPSKGGDLLSEYLWDDWPRAGTADTDRGTVPHDAKLLHSRSGSSRFAFNVSPHN